MAERQRLYLDKNHRDAIEHLVDHGEADNPSDAAKQLIHDGATRRGIWNGPRTATATGTGLKRIAAEFTRAFTWIGIALLALTIFYPIEYRLPAVFAFFAALGCSALYVAVDQYEDALDRALRRLQKEPTPDGGDEA
jgi:hypothetical protein